MPGRLAVVPRLAAGVEMLLVALAVIAATAATGSVRVGVTGSADVSTGVVVVDIAAAAALLGAGSLALSVGSPPIVGRLVAVVGVAWLASDWVGWRDGPPAVAAAGIVVAPLLVPALLHLGVAHPGGRTPARRVRVLVPVAYVVAGSLGVGVALVYDPFFDPACIADCVESPLLVDARPGLARRLAEAERWWWVGGGVVVGAGSACRLARASTVARRLLLPVLAPLGLVGLSEAARGVLLLRDPVEDAESTAFTATLLVRAVGLLLLGLGVVRFAVEWYRRDRAVAVLAESLDAGSQAPTLQETLAGSFGDDDLRVAYVLGDGRTVDSAGRGVSIEPPPGRVATSVARGGNPIAVVVHDAELAAPHEFGAAARLAVDNERLRAGILAELADLQASRARVVQLADAARRSIERDLHDGAQQRLVAVTFELRLAAAAARRSGDEARAATIDRLQTRAQAAVADLRDLAHGIFPAVLTEAGLTPALRALAGRCSIPLELHGVVERRVGPETEMTAYRVVEAWVDDVIRRSAGAVEALAVDLRDEGDRLLLELRAIGGEGMRHDLPMDVHDRVGAVGGALIIDGAAVRTELPCAS